MCHACCLTWDRVIEAMTNIIKILGEIGRLSYVSQQQARVHNTCKGNLHHKTRYQI